MALQQIEHQTAIPVAAWWNKISNVMLPNESTDDSKGDVEPETLTLSINNLASDEPGDQAEDDPADDPHLSTYQPGLGSGGWSPTLPST
jgi:hypothetical protein